MHYLDWSAGMEGTPMTDGRSKMLVAYHEVGHAICATLTPGHDPVQKVTLIPRGQARGLTWFIPGESSREQGSVDVVACGELASGRAVRWLQGVVHSRGGVGVWEGCLLN